MIIYQVNKECYVFILFVKRIVKIFKDKTLAVKTFKKLLKH